MARCHGVLSIQSFNPLPLPKQGEITGRRWRPRAQSCFNPLPLPKQGEIAGEASVHAVIEVSIRSPHVEPGATVFTDGWQGYHGLERLELTEARGDMKALPR